MSKTQIKRPGIDGNSHGAQMDIRLSPSSIHTLWSCRAGWLYTRKLLPKISFEEQESVTGVGSLFHKLAESDFDLKSLKTEEVDTQTHSEIVSFANTVKAREYYKHPAKNEVPIEFIVPGSDRKWKITGYIDRLCKPTPNSSLIVDYKTSWMPDLVKDKKQLMIYGYAEHKTAGVDPSDISIGIDYVRTGELFTYSLTKSDMDSVEAYLIRSFHLAEELLAEFEKPDFDMRRIPHSPASSACNICPMKGTCVAYRIVANPNYPDVEMSEVTSESLYKELGERLEATSINEARADTIKRTLLARMKDGDEYLLKLNKDRKFVVSPTKVVVSRDEFLETIVPEIINKSLKNTRFRDIIDINTVASRITEMVRELLPASLSAKDLGTHFMKEILPLRKEIPTKPYIKYKKLDSKVELGSMLTPVKNDSDDLI